MRPRSLLTLAAAALALAVTACGSSRPAPAVVTATTTATATAATSTSTQSLGGVANQSGSVRAPAGGPVPAGFGPVSFTAISDRTWWLLGTAPCARPVCTSIVRTTDGGSHFAGIPAPPARLAGPGAGHGVSDLRFADPLDGFAGPDAIGSVGTLWETHDGGARWRPGPAVVAFTVSAGEVYAIAGSCGHGICSNLRLEHSPAGADHWSATPLGLASSGGIALTAHGRSLWISLTPATGTPSAQTLLASTDGGTHLAHLSSPCTPGLGGDLEAASASVVWALCPTGMMAGAWRSTDAGRRWSALHARGPGGGIANSARLGAASDATAVLATGGTGAMLRTTDGGQSFTAVHGPAGSMTWVGFTDPSTASAIVDTAGAPQLWRSTNGGASFSGPLHIG